MACCSTKCERQHKCAYHINNPRKNTGIESVEDYYWYGSGSISTEGCTEHWWCGPHGNWKMFSPIDIELLKQQRDQLTKIITELEQEIYE